jgi:hypothetical protein
MYEAVWGLGERVIFRIIGYTAMVITDTGQTKVDGDPTKYIKATVVGKYICGKGEIIGPMRDFMKLQLVR